MNWEGKYNVAFALTGEETSTRNSVFILKRRAGVFPQKKKKEREKKEKKKLRGPWLCKSPTVLHVDGILVVRQGDDWVDCNCINTKSSVSLKVWYSLRPTISLTNVPSPVKSCEFFGRRQLSTLLTSLFFYESPFCREERTETKTRFLSLQYFPSTWILKGLLVRSRS